MEGTEYDPKVALGKNVTTTFWKVISRVEKCPWV